MHAVGKSDPPSAAEFIQTLPKPDFSVPVWFREIIRRGRDYTRRGEGGVLRFAPLPESGQHWLAKHQAVIEEELLNERFDTAGIDEAYTSSDDLFSTDEDEQQD
jgi:hypothetical protein